MKQTAVSRIGMVGMLCLGLAVFATVLPLASVPAVADSHAAPTPDTRKGTNPAPPVTPTAKKPGTVSAPATGSAGNHGRPLPSTAAGQGTTNMTTPAPDSKNYSSTADEAPGTRLIAEAAPLAANMPVLCGANRDGGWTTTSSTFVPIRECTLTLPEAGFVFLSATTSVGIGAGGAYEARFNLGIDTTAGNSATDRWVNVDPDTSDGSDKSAAVSLVTPVTAGTHTFSFLGARYSGAGTVQLYDPWLMVLFIPQSSVDILACGVASNTIWTTTETTFQPIQECSLAVPEAGIVFMTANASVGMGSGGAYEGRFRLGINAPTGLSSTDRWVNVYPDAGDGTDENVATSLLTEVVTGTHTFSFSGARYSGTGTVQVYDPTLSVLYIRHGAADILTCGATGSDTYTNATSEYTSIRSCTMNLPRRGAVLINADASAGLNAPGAGNEFEAQFRLGVDNASGSATTDRWVNVYTDAGDGTDRVVADSLLVPSVLTGTHRFDFVGRRYAGPGAARVYAPALAVLAFVEPGPSPTATATPTTTPTTTPTATTTGTVMPRDPAVYLPLVLR